MGKTSNEITSLISAIAGTTDENIKSSAIDLENNQWRTKEYLLKSLIKVYENMKETENLVPLLPVSKNGAIFFKNPVIRNGFFDKEKRTYKDRDSKNIFSRGYDYCIFSDHSLDSIDDYQIQYKKLFEELRDSLESDQRYTPVEETAMLDYLRIYLIVLTTSVVYASNVTDVKFSRIDRLFEKLQFVIEKYYSKLYLDLNFEVEYHQFFEDLASVTKGAFKYIKNANLELSHFKYPELDNPQSIYKFAYTVFKKNDPPDYVCGIVSGGVEIAMLIKFLFRFYAKSKTELGIIYFSRYTSKKVENNSNAPSIKYFSGKNGPKLNKTAIIVDDNSNTGKTLQNVSDYLSTFGYTLKAYVAEFDPYRVLYKQKNFVKPPDTISNPNLFSCSVNIVPISYDGNQCLPFKQLRKLWRSDVVLDYYKSLLPLINSKNLSYSPFQGITSVDVKACAVHNLIDFLNLYNSGVRWFGIHCLYDSILYREKILRTKNSFLINLYEKLFEYIYGDVGGCPLLEMDSIIDMMNYIHDNDLNVNVVFLIDLNNFEKTTNTIKEKILKKDFFNANIFFQIQNRYNRKLINIFRKKYPEFKNIIQVISLNDTNPRYVLKKINKDKDIKYVIFDSAQYGGTGQEGPIDVLQDLTVACEKQFFIAGGINAENVKIKINQLLARSTNFKIDIESGFEDKKNYVLDIFSQSLLTLRKSNKKIMDFFEILNFEAQRIINCRRYNALTLNDVSEFKNKYLNAWRLAMKTAGYYSTNTFIEYFAKSLIKESNSLPLLNKEKVLSIIRNGLISYSNVPDNPHLLLDDKYLTSEYYRDKGSPWLIKRTEGFLRDTCRLKNLNRFIIWTKGENEVDTNISEQRYKANRSGLTSLVNKYMDQKDHFFVTSPNKERLITSQEKDKIVVIDDTLENLVKVNCLYKEKDVCLIWLTPLGKKRTDGIKPMSSLYQVLSFLKTLKIPFSIYCDMDGVLIHEKFRNEHQPKNLFFELMNNNLVNDNELYRPYSPLSGESFDYINNKLKHASQKVVLISGPSGSGKSTLIKEVLKILPSVKYIKRITTRVQRINEVNHSNYEFVNETYFKFLVEQQRLLEYGYFGPGYYGTKIDTLLSVLNRGKKAVFEADADTVLYMTSVFKKLKIDFVTVLIVPSDMKDVTSSMNYLKTRINKRDAYQSSKDENSGRLKKAEYILSLVNRFDKIVVNENSLLERAKKDLLQIIED